MASKAKKIDASVSKPAADSGVVVKKAVPAEKNAPVEKAIAAETAPKKIEQAEAAAKAKRTPAKPSTKTPTAKETIMTKAQTKTADFTAKVSEGFADLQTRAKAVYEKGSEQAAEVGQFAKGNVEAVVESSKIFAAGVQDMGKSYVAEAKNAVETATADLKEVSAVRSPTEFVELQSKIASRNFDATIAAFSKGTEAWVKLTNEAFAPISNRVSLAMEKVGKAA